MTEPAHEIERLTSLVQHYADQCGVTAEELQRVHNVSDPVKPHIDDVRQVISDFFDDMRDGYGDASQIRTRCFIRFQNMGLAQHIDWTPRDQ